jgi:pimeloyl-ACP methyl ester carboxylesterase
MYQRKDISGDNQWPDTRFDPDPSETNQAIVFVHGWNTSPQDATTDAETMFKRLWHRGFKGRYGTVRWKTDWSSSFSGVPLIGQQLSAYLAHYNDSEYQAWLAGAALQRFAAELNGFELNFVAHSMGNVVVGSALKQGMSISHYALLHAAVPSSCYDVEPYLRQPQTAGAFGYTYWDTRTPDDDSGILTRVLAYRGQLSTTHADLTNFYLEHDRATTYGWEFNNRAFRPSAGYFYDRSEVDGSRLWKNESAIRRPLSDANEAMPYADQTWGKVAGAEGRTAGAIHNKISLESADYSLPGDSKGFKDDHSAEFSRSIQQQLQPFYYDLLDSLGVKPAFLNATRP